MIKHLLLSLAAMLLLSACVSTGVATPDSAPSPTSADVARPIVRNTSELAPATTREPKASATVVERVETPTPRATQPPPPPSPTPTLISEVLADEAPPPVVVPGGTSLPLPANTTVAYTGCASDGTCYAYNFYWAPTHEVVMQPGEGEHKVWHERCHAHQHWVINGGAPLPPSDYDLESWYGTGQGVSYMNAVAGLSWPWTHSHQNGLEDFAWTCGYYYYDPAHLLNVSPERYRWAAANLP